MDNKVCPKCKILKSVEEFSKCSTTKDRLQSHCKQCQKDLRVVYRSRPEIAARQREYSEEWRNKNSQRVKRNNASWNEANVEYYKTWRANNSERNLEREKKKRREDPLYQLSCNLRGRIKSGIKNAKVRKDKQSVELLGCTWIECKEYLESKFEPWMNWSNHGDYDANRKTWQIDHIKPIATFNLIDPEEQKLCFHYTNLQPLLALHNLKKGKYYQSNNK